MQARAVPADRPPASDLLNAMVAELLRIYPWIENGVAPSATPAEMTPPVGTYVVVFDDDGRPLAGGGVKRLDDGVAEIKRMYVVPESRGRGVARMLLSAVEDAARELGYNTIRLDTGALQPHARALYESAGYRSIADYNANPYAVFWGEKDL